MTDEQILQAGYWVNIYTMSAHNNFGYEINKKLRLSWRTELNKGNFKTPQLAREQAVKELTYIIQNNG
jgi:hypothetical protein